MGKVLLISFRRTMNRDKDRRADEPIKPPRDELGESEEKFIPTKPQVESSGKEPGPIPPPFLEFKPDERKLAKIALFRRITLWGTLIFIAGMLLWAIVFLPRISPQRKVEEKKPPGAELTPEEKAAPPRVDYQSSAGKEAVVSKEEKMVWAQARAMGRSIDSSVNIAINQWQRVQKLIDIGKMAKDKIEEALKRIESARAVSDSAGQMVELAQRLLTGLQALTRTSGSGSVRVRGTYAAAREYLRLVAEERGDRENYLFAWEQAVRALKDGDEAEFEIKENVANGYLKKSETRQKRLSRSRAQLKAALSY